MLKDKGLEFANSIPAFTVGGDEQWLMDACQVLYSFSFWGSRSFGAKNNDLLQVFVFTGLLERLF